MISLLSICPLLWIFGDFLSLCFDFLSTFALFLELFSPSVGLNYIPLYLFFLYFCIATILGLIVSILPLFLGFLCIGSVPTHQSSLTNSPGSSDLSELSGCSGTDFFSCLEKFLLFLLN